MRYADETNISMIFMSYLPGRVNNDDSAMNAGVAPRLQYLWASRLLIRVRIANEKDLWQRSFYPVSFRENGHAHGILHYKRGSCR